MSTSQIAKAEAFRALHRGPVLLLPNAWDAVSARLFAEEGFPAVATTSGGLSWSLGYPDGERAPWDEVVAATRRIARALAVPVSADIEGGFGDTPAEVGERVREIVAAGVAGINIEDGSARAKGALRPIEEAVERVRAARRAAEASGVPLFVNARTDVFHRDDVPAVQRPAEALRRALAYVEAGADGIFLFGNAEIAVLAEVARQIPAPVNIVGRAGMPEIAQIGRLGIARISTASGPAMAALTTVRNVARTLRSGRLDCLVSDVKRPDLQAWFAEKLP